MRISTTTVALIVLICTLLFGGIIVSRSYFEGFEVDASGNEIPSPNTPTTQAPVQNVAPQFRSLVLDPQGQPITLPMMAPQGQPMMMAPQGQPMMAPQGQPMMMAPQGPPLMPPMALPMDAHIMLPIQSPVFARSRVNMGAPYQPAQFMQNPGEQVGPTQVMQMPNIFTPEVLNQQTMLLDQSKQAASRGDMAAAISLKQAASQIGRG